MILKRAMIITISSKEWDMSKSILMEYKGNSDRLDEMAKELFEDYKKLKLWSYIIELYMLWNNWGNGRCKSKTDASQRQTHNLFRVCVRRGDKKSSVWLEKREQLK